MKSIRQIQKRIIQQFYSKIQMSRQDHSTYNHANFHLANIKANSNIISINHLIKSTSRRIKHNQTLNPTHSHYKHEVENQSRKKHSETVQVSREHQIYFNRTKKYNYMKQIIDKYFDQSKREKHAFRAINPQNGFSKNMRTLIPRIVKQRQEKQQENHAENTEDKQKNRQFLLNKRKNKTFLQKDDEQQLHNSLQINSKTINQKQSQPQLSKQLSFSSTKAINLPPIDEMFEDKDDEIGELQYQSLSIINDSSLGNIDSLKENRILAMDNEIYIIEMIIINGRVHHKIKTFKEKGQQILKRQIRANHLGAESVWIQYRYDPRSLISAPNKSLKDLLFKINKVDIDCKFLSLKPKRYHKRLTANNCEEIIRAVRQFCQFMKKFQGKMLNNKINTANIFLTKNENFRLGEWGFASFKQTHLIQNMQFQNRIEPIVKSQKEWFVAPQYLAPQILKAIVFSQDVDLMSYGSAPDIWSLGVALLEILTIIPVWIHQKCTIFGKTTAARSGLLSIGDRDLKKLLKRQQKFPYLVSKLFEDEFLEQNLNNKLTQIIVRCISFEPLLRPTFDEIIQFLK